MSKKVKIQHWLLPASWLYGVGVWLRDRLFHFGLLRQRSFGLPVICVGNLTVGGTGKTPHTEYLIRLLQPQWQVAVLSRGYKRQTRGFVLAQADTPAAQTGDEPCQMKRKFPNVIVAVDEDRCHGIDSLTDGSVMPAPQVILLDDAFQHRYVRPGLSILLTDYSRLITRDALLPAGRLREPVSALRRADMVIVTKCPADLSETDCEAIRTELPLRPDQELYFTALRYGSLRPLSSEGSMLRLEDIGGETNVLLLTGIASPAALIQELSRYTAHISPLTFPDHHAFTARDLETLRNRFQQSTGRTVIITTEKDAARLSPWLPSLGELLPHLYVLPVEVTFLRDQQDLFHLNINRYVRENTRNSRLS